VSDIDELFAITEILERKKRYNHIDTIFPEDGPLRRALYKNHMAFFEAGQTHWVRLIQASNQTGKSQDCCYELSCHLTGIYPPWWKGKRLSRACDWLIVGETYDLLRKSIIQTLLGPVGDFGTGMIRGDTLDHATMKQVERTGTNIGSFRVKHISGKFCNVYINTYSMRREDFQAFKANVLFDEEPPPGLFNEAITRTLTMGDDRLVMINFTPMNGMTDFLKNFMEGKPSVTGPISEDKHLTRLRWDLDDPANDDAPHLTRGAKEALLRLWPAYMRATRSRGDALVGEGLIYPCAPEKIFVPRFKIPDHYKRVFSLDFGWNPDPTAIAWVAIDPDTGVHYQYWEYYRTEAPLSQNAAAIWDQNKIAGYDIPGICDPSGGKIDINDGGRHEMEQYRTQFRIDLHGAKNALRGGHAVVYQLILDDKWKVFDDLPQTRSEWSGYAIKDGKIKGADHLMDNWRYIALTGHDHAKSKHDIEKEREVQDLKELQDYSGDSREDSWMMQ